MMAPRLIHLHHVVADLLKSERGDIAAAASRLAGMLAEDRELATVAKQFNTAIREFRRRQSSKSNRRPKRSPLTP